MTSESRVRRLRRKAEPPLRSRLEGSELWRRAGKIRRRLLRRRAENSPSDEQITASMIEPTGETRELQEPM